MEEKRNPFLEDGEELMPIPLIERWANDRHPFGYPGEKWLPDGRSVPMTDEELLEFDLRRLPDGKIVEVDGD